jgi:hypothetical protein
LVARLYDIEDPSCDDRDVDARVVQRLRLFDNPRIRADLSRRDNADTRAIARLPMPIFDDHTAFLVSD